MFGAPVTNGLTFTKVISGLSKTLSIANQVIPLYREAKPIINNAKTIFSVLKDINSDTNKTTAKKQINKTQEIKKESLKVRNNSPVFFV